MSMTRPAMRPGPIEDDKRGSLLMHMAVGPVKAYLYFEPARRAASMQGGRRRSIVRQAPKVGRNEACPCGSGRKYEHCHGAQ